jgi:hypothetical protein
MVTMNSILEELKTHFDRVEDGLTIYEMCELTGIPRTTIHAKIRKWVMDGSIVVVKLRRSRIDGVVTTVTGYR